MSPNILVDPRSAGSTVDVTSVSYNYDYPGRLDLRPGSKMHNRIKNEIIRRAHEARNQMNKRFDSWGEIDETLTAYVKLSDHEKDLKKKNTKVPSTKKPLSIVFPYS